MIKSFFQTLLISLFPQPNTYKHLIKRIPFHSALYLTICIFTLCTLYSFSKVIYHFQSDINYFSIRKSIFKELDKFPKDTKINLIQGKLTTSYDRPYFVWAQINGQPHPLIIIDEYSNASKMELYGSTILMNSDSVHIRSKNQIQTFKYPNHINISLTQQNSKFYVTFIKTIYILFPIITISYLFIIKPIVSILQILFLLLLFSFIIFWVLRLVKRHIHFQSILHLGLYSTTFPLILFYSLLILNVPFKSTLWFPLAIFLFLLTAVYEVYIWKDKRTKNNMQKT